MFTLKGLMYLDASHSVSSPDQRFIYTPWDIKSISPDATPRGDPRGPVTARIVSG